MVGFLHVLVGERLVHERTLEVLAVVVHVVGVVAAHDDAHLDLRVVVVIDEVRHLGGYHAQFAGQFHLRIGHALHRVELYACHGILNLALVGIDAGHVALGRDGQRDALQGHVGLGSVQGIGQRLCGGLNLRLRSVGIVLHALGGIDGCLQHGGSVGVALADAVVVGLGLGDGVVQCSLVRGDGHVQRLCGEGIMVVVALHLVGHGVRAGVGALGQSVAEVLAVQ